MCWLSDNGKGKGKDNGKVAVLQVVKTCGVGGRIAVDGGNGKLHVPAALSSWKQTFCTHY